MLGDSHVVRKAAIHGWLLRSTVTHLHSVHESRTTADRTDRTQHNANFHQKNRRRPTDRRLAEAPVPPSPSQTRRRRGRRAAPPFDTCATRARRARQSAFKMRAGPGSFLGCLPHACSGMGLSFDLATLGILIPMDPEWPPFTSSDQQTMQGYSFALRSEMRR